MAGFWELPRPSVLVAVLTSKDIVSSRWAFAFRQLQLPPGHFIMEIAGRPYDDARNFAARECLRGGFSNLLFIDDDVIAPSDGAMRLLSYELPVVGGLYYRRHMNMEPLMLRRHEKGGLYITECNIGDLVPVDWTAAGFLLINRLVLERLDGPLGGRWFQWKMEPHVPEGERRSEDYFFADQVKAAGFPIHVATAVQCEHVGMGKARMPGQFVPVTA